MRHIITLSEELQTYAQVRMFSDQSTQKFESKLLKFLKK